MSHKSRTSGEGNGLVASAELNVEVCNKSWSTQVKMRKIKKYSIGLTVDVVVALAGDLEWDREGEVGNLDRVQVNALQIDMSFR